MDAPNAAGRSPPHASSPTLGADQCRVPEEFPVFCGLASFGVDERNGVPTERAHRGSRLSLGWVEDRTSDHDLEPTEVRLCKLDGIRVIRVRNGKAMLATDWARPVGTVGEAKRLTACCPCPCSVV